MHILLTARKFTPPFVGGVDVYASRLAKALQRLGHTVGILAFDPSGASVDEGIQLVQEHVEGLPVTRLKFAFSGRPPETFDLAYDGEMGANIHGVLRQLTPDLFVVMNFYTVTLAAVEAADELGIPVVHIATDFVPICRRATFIRWDGSSCEVGESIKSCSSCFISHRLLGRVASTVLETFPDSVLTSWAGNQSRISPPHPLSLLSPYLKQVRVMDQRLRILERLRPRIKHVLAPTQYTARMFSRNGFSNGQVRLLPFGVETHNPLTEIRHKPASHIRFLFVGRLQPYKGAHLLVDAFNQLNAPRQATLTIYGGADGYEDYFKELKARMASNPNIRHKGTIAPEELGAAFADADYFVLPSTWHENSPLIVLDALQSKTPVIASDIGGVTDLVHHGVNGLLFPMGDRLGLQHTLQDAIDQPELIAKLRRGPSLITIDDYASTLIELLN